MPEIINQPTTNIPVQTTVPSQTAEQLPPKRKSSLIWILLLILILAVVGGVYYYFNFRQTAPSLSPTENPELIPTSAEVSSSTDVNTLEKELNDTDLGSFEKDLNQLDLNAGQF